jgi:hypothetical protein
MSSADQGLEQVTRIVNDNLHILLDTEKTDPTVAATYTDVEILGITYTVCQVDVVRAKKRDQPIVTITLECKLPDESRYTFICSEQWLDDFADKVQSAIV